MKKFLSTLVGMGLLLGGISIVHPIGVLQKVQAANNVGTTLPWDRAWDHQVHSIQSLYFTNFHPWEDDTPKHIKAKVDLYNDVYNKSKVPGYEDWQRGENPDNWNMYINYISKKYLYPYEGMAHRNLKKRSANIYVKDKSLLPEVKAAIKMWKPGFKFNLVNSMKHAKFRSTSKKYANIVICDDPYSEEYDGNKSWTGSELIEVTDKKLIKSRHIKYWDGNGQVHKKKKGQARLNDDVANICVLTKNMSKQRKINEIASQLGQIIGIGYNDAFFEDIYKTYGTNDISAFHGLEEYGEDEDENYVSEKMLNSQFVVTQMDVEHINWIYAHPYDGYSIY
ncbi:hypothetical protein FP435_03440 [Lactobacillus sp. PV037]|uniref:hypothetical protein n=1 Tax=unclassified Lactobacillus TaxID=2620435 RepID=UPI00223FEC18|nr:MULTISPECIES: hypothetical protein [unclassified Lactobacillus]QNQ82326.1 hypothetical protein FP433_04390 [Lactobacillus sp. PV012]QNQ83562.1 hypothetical protein FP435_03440 [Lactobacillus sp. PV037]